MNEIISQTIKHQGGKTKKSNNGRKEKSERESRNGVYVWAVMAAVATVVGEVLTEELAF